MKPFAYQLTYRSGTYQKVEVFPTLQALAEFLIKEYKVTSWEDLSITAWYERGQFRSTYLSLTPFLVANDLDEEAIRLDIRKKIDEEAVIRTKRRAEGHRGYSGEVWWSDIGEEALLAGAIKAQQYSWAPLESINWAQLEDGLVKQES